MICKQSGKYWLIETRYIMIRLCTLQWSQFSYISLTEKTVKLSLTSSVCLRYSSISQLTHHSCTTGSRINVHVANYTEKNSRYFVSNHAIYMEWVLSVSVWRLIKSTLWSSERVCTQTGNDQSSLRLVIKCRVLPFTTSVVKKHSSLNRPILVC